MTARDIPTLPELFHVGIVVADSDAAAQLYGIEPTRVLELTDQPGLMLDEPMTFSARYVFLSVGNTEIELIEPLGGISPYSEFLDESGGGVHHLAFVVGSIAAHLAHWDDGRPLLADVTLSDGVRFVYVEATAGGATLELIEVPEGQSVLPDA